jgi:membrane fusion protein (multidrug efflux system)
MSDELASEPQLFESPPPPGPARNPVAGRRNGRRRRVAVVLIGLAVVAAAYGAYAYVWSRSHEETDDAQVEGHIHAVSSHVAGYVAQVCVEDNQLVAAGDVLVRVRSDDYEARVALAESTLDVTRGSTAATLTQARAGVQQAEAQLDAAQRDADSAASRLTAAVAGQQQARSQAAAAQAESDYASSNHRRIAALHAQNQAAEDEAQLAESNARAAAARLVAASDAVNLAEAQAQAARHAVDSAKAAIAVAEAAIETQKGKLADALTGPDQVRVAEARVALARATALSAQAQLDLARIDLAYCTITAPVAGVVSTRSVEAGQYLQPGQPLLALVPLGDTWVLANFKETQLHAMRVGQPVRLHVDAYPDHPFQGTIDSLAAGTGARFSLLPPENATGNFVKVVQRVPVKIVLAAGQRDPQRPLRAGLNVVVTVDTGAPPAATTQP